MIKQMTNEEIVDKLYDELDNEVPGTVFDFELVPGGWHDGLQHNGVWVRIVKFDEHNYAFALQTDSYDEDPGLADLDTIAECVEMHMIAAIDMEEADRRRLADEETDRQRDAEFERKYGPQ